MCDLVALLWYVIDIVDVIVEIVMHPSDVVAVDDALVAFDLMILWLIEHFARFGDTEWMT